MTRAADAASQVPRRAATAELFAAASRGELHVVMHELLPLEQAVLAHQKMDAGEVFGRIVLVPSGTSITDRSDGGGPAGPLR